MTIDSVYFAYVSKMPSVAQLKMSWQIDDVWDTVKMLIGFKQMAPTLDLPIWYLYFINRKHQINDIKKCKSLFPLITCMVSIVTALSVTFIAGDFKPQYLVNELYCYHAYDDFRTIASHISERNVDKNKYTLKADKDSEYWGVAKDRNVIVIQVEALQNFVIGAYYEGQELTPNLNKLISNDSIYFDNYYYQIGGGNTSDAEFAVNNSLFGPENSSGYVTYQNNNYHGLPYLLKDNGYSGAYAFHGYYGYFWNRENAYPNQGFDDFISMEDYDQNDMFYMGLSDNQLFSQSFNWLETYEEPFYAFYITVSSHHPYSIPEEYRAITLKAEDEGTLFGQYIQSVNYFDSALGNYIDELKAKGLYDNSIIVIYGDHYALTNTDYQISSQVSSMIDRSYTIYDVFSVPLIINIPGISHNETISISGGHIDVLPTLLCLLGIENDKAVMFGQNLLTATSGFVCEQTHLAQGSFINDEVFFSKPYNNIESNYSVYKRGTMEKLSPSDFYDISDIAYNRIKDCEKLLADNDILLD